MRVQRRREERERERERERKRERVKGEIERRLEIVWWKDTVTATYIECRESKGVKFQEKRGRGRERVVERQGNALERCFLSRFSPLPSTVNVSIVYCARSLSLSLHLHIYTVYLYAQSLRKIDETIIFFFLLSPFILSLWLSGVRWLTLVERHQLAALSLYLPPSLTRREDGGRRSRPDARPPWIHQPRTPLRACWRCPGQSQLQEAHPCLVESLPDVSREQRQGE
jgi:hypothetical protein